MGAQEFKRGENNRKGNKKPCQLEGALGAQRDITRVIAYFPSAGCSNRKEEAMSLEHSLWFH